MNQPVLWSADEVRDIIGGRWVSASPALGTYQRLTFPLQYTRPNTIILHVHGREWPKKTIEGSGQKGMSVDDLVRHARQHPNVMIITSQETAAAADVPVLVVESTYNALFALAEYQRARFKGRIVGITGTAGKSSTRDFLSAILSAKGATFASFGNWNTVEGIALSLANLPPQNDFAVIEISGGAIAGMRGRTALEMVRHHDAIITSIGVNLTSRTPTAKDVAEVKSKLFSSLPPDGCAYFAADVQEIETLHSAAGNHRRRVIGDSSTATLAMEPLSEEPGMTRLRVALPNYTAEVQTHIVGPGPLSNLALASQCALDLGVAPELLVNTIPELSLARRKMELHDYTIHDKKIYLLNDCHNATLVSFSSVLTYIRNISNHYKRSIFVIGKIVHIEGLERDVYRTLAQDIKNCEPDVIILFADGLEPLEHSLKSLRANVCRAIEIDQVLELVESNMTDGSLVFLKGSARGTQMRNLARLLQKQLERRSITANRQPALQLHPPSSP
jgi:UDP-N-acetylmuramyl pentapeptide synthase